MYYLLTDHLRSTAITANSSGTRVAELRCKGWGETRYSYSTTPTAYHFTGQRKDDTIGLYYYGARYYDPVLGQFVQPDTMVPNPGNPQDLNRSAIPAITHSGTRTRAVIVPTTAAAYASGTPMTEPLRWCVVARSLSTRLRRP